MRFHSLLPVLGSLVGLLACQGTDQPAVFSGIPKSQTGDPLTLIRLRPESTAFLQNSGVTAAENLVVRDAAAWSALWQRMFATRSPQPPLPDVDFSQEMIVATALGSRTSGGHNVLLTDAAEDQDGVHIGVIETSPGAGCAVTLAFTQPIDLARVTRRDGAVSFHVTRRVENCSS